MGHRRSITPATRLFILTALITLLPLAAASPIYADGTWIDQVPTASPPARFRHAVASLGGHQVLVFGGIGHGFVHLGDTWVYDLGDNTWTEQDLAISPSPRNGHAMAWIGGDKVLLFGGNDEVSNIYFGDTWVYDLSENTWTNRTPATAPSPRFTHAMAWIGGDKVLLFGGYGADSGFSDETWVYDVSDNTWTEQDPAMSPSARTCHAMAWLGGDQVLLFGGYSFDGNTLGDTWVYDLSSNTWTDQAPAAAPSVRYYHAMAWLGGDQALLFGGVPNLPPSFSDTWVYDLSDNTWAEQTPAAGPSARYGHAVAWISWDKVLMFGGGESGYLFADTWLASGFYSGHRVYVYLPLVFR